MIAAGRRDCFYAEGQASSQLYGALGAPSSQHELERLFEAMRDKLEPSAIVFEFLDIMQRVELLPRPLAPLQALLVKAAVAITPDWVRGRLGLGADWDLQRWQRLVIRRIGLAADRIVLRSAPPAQSCRRLGLPEDYLYQGCRE
jgi:uncharacterized protein (DUF2236 family)